MEEDSPPKSIWQKERERRLQKEKEKMEKEGKQISSGFDVEQSKPGTSRGEQQEVKSDTVCKSYLISSKAAVY